MACLNVGALVVYIGAQTSIALLFGRDQASLKLVLEPFLLLLGLVLHIQWRTIGGTFLEHGLRRPLWVAVGDCASFMVTFWALVVLADAFFHQVRN